MSTVFAGDVSPTFFYFRQTVVFEDVKLSLVWHMESNFDDETRCACQQPVMSIVREGLMHLDAMFTQFSICGKSIASVVRAVEALA